MHIYKIPVLFLFTISIITTSLAPDFAVAKEKGEALKRNEQTSEDLKKVSFRSLVRKKAWEQFAEKLKLQSNISQMDLGFLNITDDDVKHILEPVLNHKGIKRINLIGNNITGKGARMISELAAGKEELKEIDLRMNKIPLMRNPFKILATHISPLFTKNESTQKFGNWLHDFGQGGFSLTDLRIDDFKNKNVTYIKEKYVINFLNKVTGFVGYIIYVTKKFIVFLPIIASSLLVFPSIRRSVGTTIVNMRRSYSLGLKQLIGFSPNYKGLVRP